MANEVQRMGISSYGTYLPRWRLSASDVATAMGGSTKGKRTVASFDEDSTTLGVAAAFDALRSGVVPSTVWFATTSPAYVDKTNATTIHAALSLPADVAAFDLGASTRSASAALRAAAASGGLAVLADVRGGIPGSADERASADGAAAFVFSDTDPVAELIGTGTATAEFLDRWAGPGDAGSHTWEERFGEGEYLPLSERAVNDALKDAGITIAEVDTVVVSGPNARAVKSAGTDLRKRAGQSVPPAQIVDSIGNSGTAGLGLALADALDGAAAGQTILVVGLADGADAFIFRTTELLATTRGRTVRSQIDGGLPVSYPKYLLWRGHLTREGPRRPDPVRPSAPFSSRNAPYKFGFIGGECRECGTVQYPLPAVCLRCQARDSCNPVSGAEATGRIVTFTVDNLAFTPNPPLISAVVDLDGGGRVTVEVADILVDALSVCLPVRTTFRRLMTVDGIHNYFWKAGPL